MEEFTWDKSLETGEPSIDEQHKQLFVAINNLLDLCRAGKGKEELSKSLDFLTNYTIKHFFDEEQIQRKYEYPDYVNHKMYHDNFKITVRDLSHQLILKGPSDQLIDDVKSKIGNWLITHIKIQDLKLAAHLKAKKAGS
jgi:hemerythrin